MLFISPKKFFSFWRYSNFCSDFFSDVGKQLDKKAKVNFKIYNFPNWETNNYNTHVAQYLKKDKSNSGQIIEYNIRNIFLEKLYKNVVEKLVPDPLLKNQNWAYPWINSLKFYIFRFYFMSKSRDIKIYIDTKG